MSTLGDGRHEPGLPYVILIGRERELAAVRKLLVAGKNFAIVGPEGVGKTALVLEATKDMPRVLYCADTSTLKKASESLLMQLGLSIAATDNIQRKRSILKATAGRKRCFVFDHVQYMPPKLFSLLDAIREAHQMVVVTRSLAWSEIGHLKMILWDFDRRQLNKLRQADAFQLIMTETERLGLEVPSPQQFARTVWRLSGGNPHTILDICARAARGHYIFGTHLSTQLLDLDRRIEKLHL